MVTTTKNKNDYKTTTELTNKHIVNSLNKIIFI